MLKMLAQMKEYEQNLLFRLLTKPGQLCSMSRLQFARLSHRVSALIQIEPYGYHFMAWGVEEESQRRKERMNHDLPMTPKLKKENYMIEKTGQERRSDNPKFSLAYNGQLEPTRSVSIEK